MGCLRSIIYSESKYLTQPGEKNVVFCFAVYYRLLGLCFMVLRRQGPCFMGGEIIITNAEKDKRL